MLPKVRLIEHLVVNAGVDGGDLHAPQGRDDRPLLRDRFRRLAEPRGIREIHAAGVRRDAPPTRGSKLAIMLEEAQTGIAHHFDVAHHVDVGDRDEAFRPEELSDLDLLLDGLRNRGPILATPHRFFVLIQLHRLSLLT